MKKLLSLVILAASVSCSRGFDEPEWVGRTAIYVATNGSDQNLGGKSDPLLTIQYALLRATAFAATNGTENHTMPFDGQSNYIIYIGAGVYKPRAGLNEVSMGLRLKTFTYNESIIYPTPTFQLIFSGGWNANFSGISGMTVFDGEGKLSNLVRADNNPSGSSDVNSLSNTVFRRIRFTHGGLSNDTSSGGTVYWDTNAIPGKSLVSVRFESCEFVSNYGAGGTNVAAPSITFGDAMDQASSSSSGTSSSISLAYLTNSPVVSNASLPSGLLNTNTLTNGVWLAFPLVTNDYYYFTIQLANLQVARIHIDDGYHTSNSSDNGSVYSNVLLGLEYNSTSYWDRYYTPFLLTNTSGQTANFTFNVARAYVYRTNLSYWAAVMWK